jgi:hypothetical protein
MLHEHFLNPYINLEPFDVLSSWKTKREYCTKVSQLHSVGAERP